MILKQVTWLRLYGLKSDHFGIEIFIKLQCYFLPFLLKSDHFGIEIDPTFAVNTLEAKLKSDHFGIEISLFS